MKKNKKSPIKEKTLRHPGQSLDEQLDTLINEKGMIYLVSACLAIILAALEWLKYYQNTPPSPKTMTFLCTMIVLFCVYRLYTIIKKAKSLKLGREGERAVGQFLESLRADGCVIFHDIIAENFNLDHVIVSKKGIFAIETKTYSKPEKGEAKIIYDGERISIQGAGTYGQPIVQVRSASRWLKNILLETTGRSLTVKPVILFPGWFVESTEQGKRTDTWALNPKSLPAFIKNQIDMISQEDMQMIVYHLCRYVRVKEAERT